MRTRPFTSRMMVGLWSCAALFGADLLGSSGALAQTVSQPTCSHGGTIGGGAADNASASFICIADLDGNGTLKIIVGSTAGSSGNSGYLMIMNKNATVVRKTCWGGITCPTVQP